jgi:hypothetical protein
VVASSACGAAEPEAPQEAAVRNPSHEQTGEAKEPATVAECLAQYNFNMQTCDAMPPDAKVGCVLATHYILVHCLKTD